MQALLAAVWRRIVPDREISAKKVEMSRKCPVCARCGQQAEEMAHGRQKKRGGEKSLRGSAEPGKHERRTVFRHAFRVSSAPEVAPRGYFISW